MQLICDTKQLKLAKKKACKSRFRYSRERALQGHTLTFSHPHNSKYAQNISGSLLVFRGLAEACLAAGCGPRNYSQTGNAMPWRFRCNRPTTTDCAQRDRCTAAPEHGSAVPRSERGVRATAKSPSAVLRVSARSPHESRSSGDVRRI